MTKLYIVASGVEADAGPSGRVIGAYTDAAVAQAVQAVAWGNDASVTCVEVDQVDPELRQAMDALRIQCPQSERQNTHAATKFALVASLIAFAVTFAVNGQDPVRAGIAALLWFCLGWYAGKTIYPPQKDSRVVASR